MELRIVRKKKASFSVGLRASGVVAVSVGRHAAMMISNVLVSGGRDRRT